MQVNTMRTIKVNDSTIVQIPDTLKVFSHAQYDGVLQYYNAVVSLQLQPDMTERVLQGSMPLHCAFLIQPLMFGYFDCVQVYKLNDILKQSADQENIEKVGRDFYKTIQAYTHNAWISRETLLALAVNTYYN